MRWCTKIFGTPIRVVLAIVLNGLRLFHVKYKAQLNAELHRTVVSGKKRLDPFLACKQVSKT
jgi:hypothetical protein